MSTKTDLKLQKEVVEKLLWLGSFGRESNGGVSRLLYSQAWVDAQKSLKKLFQDDGLTVHFDEVGNLFGRLEGTAHKDETILTGSHVDTVKNGGLYDGQYGIMAAFLTIKYLKENYGAPLRNIEVVSFAEEEGSRFPYSFWGVKNLVGKAEVTEVQRLCDVEGISFDAALHQAGFHYRENNYSRNDIKAFIELHVEQGGVLEAKKIPLGIVEHIVGQRRMTVEIKGQANHAGCTPMGYRKDALHAASRMINMIYDVALAYGDPIVATIGKVVIEPNVVNVVPGKALFTIDARHTQRDELTRFTDEITQIIYRIAKEMNMEVCVSTWMDEAPVPMSQDLVEVIQTQCNRAGLSYKLMHSGAGHDSQIMASVIPTAMIFVPSHLGISHSPDEYTEPQHLVDGIKALIATLYELGYSNDVFFTNTMEKSMQTSKELE